MKISEKRFKSIKKSLEGNKTMESVAKKHNISGRTVGRIKRSDNFTQYKHRIFEEHQRQDWLITRGYEILPLKKPNVFKRIKNYYGQKLVRA